MSTYSDVLMDEAKRLSQSYATIIHIDRSGSAHERTLTVLFCDEDQSCFCVQQYCGSYSGLAFRYKYLSSKELRSNPEDFMLCDTGYSDWIADQWFHYRFESDMRTSPCLCEGQPLNLKPGSYK